MAESVLEIVIRARNELKESLSKIRTDLDALGKAVGGLEGHDPLKQLGDSAQGAQKPIEGLLGSLVALSNQFPAAAGAVMGLGKAFLGLELVRMVKDVADVAARAEVLGTTLKVVANNAGVTWDNISKLDKQVQSLGITAAASRQSLVLMLQSGLLTGETAEKFADTSKKALELARAAQDLAVVSGQNSSVTFERLIYNIQTMNTLGMRHLGLIINRTKAEEEYAAALGTTASALTEQEKKQAFLNEALVQTKTLAGSYAAAMGDVGKQITSLPRYIEELKESLGQLFLPAYLAIVEEFTTLLRHLKAIGEELDVNKTIAEAFGEGVRKVAAAIRIAIEYLIEFKDILIVIGGIILAGKLYAGFSALVEAIVGAKMAAAELGVIFKALNFGGLVEAIEAAAMGGDMMALARASGALFASTWAAAALAVLGGITFVIGVKIGWDIGKDMAEKGTTDPIYDWIDRRIVEDQNKMRDWATALKAGAMRVKASIMEGMGDVAGATALRAQADALEESTKKVNAAALEFQDAIEKLHNTGNAEERSIRESILALMKKQLELRDTKVEIEKALVELQRKENPNPADLKQIDSYNAQLARFSNEIKKSVDEVENLKKKLRTLGLTDAEVKEVMGKINKAAVVGAALQQMKAIDEAMTKAKKDTGLDKLVLFEGGVYIPEKDSAAINGIKTLFDALQREIEVRVRGPEKSLQTLFDSVTKGAWVGGLGIAIRNLAEGLKDIGSINALLDVLSQKWKGASDLVTQTKLNLLWQRDKVAVDELTKGIAGYTGYVTKLTAAQTLLQNVMYSMEQRTLSMKQAFQEIGLSAEQAALGFEGLGAGAKKFEVDIRALAETQTSVVMTRMNEAAQNYQNELRQLRQFNETALTEALKRTENEKKQDALRAASRRDLIDKETILTKKYWEQQNKDLSDALNRWKDYYGKVMAGERELREFQRASEAAATEAKRGLMSPWELRLSQMMETGKKELEFSKQMSAQEYEDAKKLAADIGATYLTIANDTTRSITDRRVAISNYETWAKNGEKARRAEIEANREAAKSQAELYKQISESLQGLDATLTRLAGEQKVEVEMVLGKDATAGLLQQMINATAEVAAAAPPVEVETAIVAKLDTGSMNTVVQQIKQTLSHVQGTIQIGWSAARQYAGGGPIWGPGTGTSDEVPFWGSNGEFVMRARAVKEYGLNFMYAINEMMLPRTVIPAFASGGPITSPAFSSAPSRDVVDVNLNIGGQSVSLMGERTQVRRLVSTLKNLQGV